jgi:transposase
LRFRDSLPVVGLEARMRGEDSHTGTLFSYVSCEARVPADHPLRLIRAIVDDALEALSERFATLYSSVGRPSIPPEKLLRALLLQAFFGIRSERQLMEQLNYNLPFRWFAGLSMDASVWDASTFAKNRDRLLEGDVARAFLAAIVEQPRVKALMSDEHFSVDGTLIQAWASHKSFQPKADAPDSSEPPRPEAPRGRSVTGAASLAATRHTAARPIPTRAWLASPMARRASSPTLGM